MLKVTFLFHKLILLVFLLLFIGLTINLQMILADDNASSNNMTVDLSKGVAEKKHIVLKVIGEIAYVDYGMKDGVEPGMDVVILGRMSFTQATTGESITGIIPICTGVITYVTDSFSAVRCEPGSASQVRDGNEVVLSVLYKLEQRIGREFVTPTLTIQKDLSIQPSASPEKAIMHQPIFESIMGKQIHISAYVNSVYLSPSVKYRLKGELDYTSASMVDKGDGFYGWTLTTKEIRPPGIEYYLTVKDKNGKELLAFSNPAKPQFIIVTKGMTFYLDKEEEKSLYGGRKSKFLLFQEYVKFSKEEYYYRIDMDYLYRIFSNLYSIRMGMGGLRGKGVTDRLAKSEFSAFYYGYSEVELRVLPQLSLLNKVLLGIQNEGVGAGYEGGIRIGRELDVNLLLGLLAAQKVGTQGLIKLNVPVTKSFTTAGTVSVENFPVSGETGFRMWIDFSYYLQKFSVISLRIGFAAKDIHRTGPNLGGGLSFNF